MKMGHAGYSGFEGGIQSSAPAAVRRSARRSGAAPAACLPAEAASAKNVQAKTWPCLKCGPLLSNGLFKYLKYLQTTGKFEIRILCFGFQTFFDASTVLMEHH